MYKKEIILVIAIVAAAGVFLYFYADKPIYSVPETSSTPTPTEMAMENTSVKTYISEGLGVQFQYDSAPEEGITVDVKESGNKIYVFDANTNPETGQFVEVFNKDAVETFESSIQRQVLAEYTSEDCKIEVAPSNIIGGYRVAEITYPRTDDSEKPWFANYEMCNPDYSQTNGIRYFMYDPAHPDKFVFFSIGQYAIMGHDRIPWQDTFRFR